MLKTLHVIAAVLLLGNVVVTGFWAIVLFARRDTIRFDLVARAILWADVVFTVGGGTLLTVTGILLVLRADYPVLETPWLMHGIIALAAATLIWMIALVPEQIRLHRLAREGGPALRRSFLRWNVFGWISTGLLFWGLWAMVAKR